VAYKFNTDAHRDGSKGNKSAYANNVMLRTILMDADAEYAECGSWDDNETIDVLIGMTKPLV